MSGIAGIVGIQEGMEAGLVVGGMANSEHKVVRAVALGLTVTAAGVIAGHYAGESALSFTDQFIGDGGIGFVPALAIGGNVMWHNFRESSPQKSTKSYFGDVPLKAIAASFAAFEGIESGILTSSVHTNLFTAEAVTVGVAAATVAVFGSVRLFAEKQNPTNPGSALRAARGVALLPAIYLGAKASPELLNNPKTAGLVIAATGTIAVLGAVGSFFKKKPTRKQAPTSSDSSIIL